MRFIHTSDIHIGSPLTTRLTPLRAAERKKELIATFRTTVEEALRLGAVGYFIAGDLFDNDKVSHKTAESVLSIIESTPDVTFFYLPGNHEKDRLSEEEALPKNLKIFGEGWTKFRIGNITISGRSKTEKNMFDALSLSPEDKNIIILHGELSDHSDEGGIIGKREIEKLPIDYLALGHYHSYSESPISARCTAVYCGTPEGRGFDETGDKGYVVLDVGDTVKHKFVKRALRTLHIVNVSLDGVIKEREIEDRVYVAIEKIPSKDIVRVLLTGRCIPGLTRDTEAIAQRFASKFYVFDVKDNARLAISADEYKNDRSLKGEFIRLVLSKNELSDEEKDRIIDCGLRALLGEE